MYATHRGSSTRDADQQADEAMRYAQATQAEIDALAQSISRAVAQATAQAVAQVIADKSAMASKAQLLSGKPRGDDVYGDISREATERRGTKRARKAGEAVGDGITKVTKVIGFGLGVAKVGTTKVAKGAAHAVTGTVGGVGSGIGAFARGFWSKL